MKARARTMAVVVWIVATTTLVLADKGDTQDKGTPSEKKIVRQTTCPVMGGKINKILYVDHDGKRVYACCKGCIPKLKKDPAKYIKKLNDQGVTLTKVQTTCPVMGGKINKNAYVDHDGKRVYICCSGCIKMLKADPEKYIKKLEAEGVTLDKVQTTCPVMGGKIDKSLYVDHNGKRIYVCCKGCVEKVKKDTEKYIKKLEGQGIVLAPGESRP